MLIGCITGPDLETAKKQLKEAAIFCDGIELRIDLLQEKLHVSDCFVMKTDQNGSILSDGRTMSTYHNFHTTPRDLETILMSLPKADIYKIATMANTITDALRMLTFVKNKPNVAGMCMGEFGQITRILGPICDNPFTFAALGGKTASPCQIQAKELVWTYHFHKLSPTTKIYGLIGNPIIQSKGHLFHNMFFQSRGIDAVYVRMFLQEEELPLFFSLAKQIGFSGLSVTMPFKEKIMPYIDSIEKEGLEIGAINTLTFKDLMYGANTDGKGALDAIEEKIPVQGKKLLLLGGGGSAKAIAFEAKKRGGEVHIASRRFGNLDNIPLYDILINTIPIPNPIRLEALQPFTVVMDISLSHKKSAFLQRAKELQCILIDGMEMFEKQARRQHILWGFSSQSGSALGSTC